MILKLVVVVLASLAAGGRTEPRPSLLTDRELQSAGMFRYWEARLPIPSGDVVERLYRVDDALYATTDRCLLFAIAADTGLVRWAEKVAEVDHQVYPPAHVRTADGTGPLIVTTTTTVLLYDRYSGALLQRFAPPFAAGSPAVGYDGILFMGSADARFYSLQLTSAEPFKRWMVAVDGPVTTTPVLVDRDRLVFAGQGGTVYSCTAEDRTLNWRFRVGGPIMADVAVDESGVYVASLDRSLYKADLATGRLAWRVRLPQPLTEGPAAVAHTAFQYCVGHGLSAIDADTGAERWRRPDARAFVAHSGAGDLVLTSDRRLALVNHEDGAVLVGVAAPDVAGAVSNTLDDAAYLFGADGRVLCARLDDVPYLRRQQVLSARQRLHQPPQAKAAPDEEGGTSAMERTGEAKPDDPLRSRRDGRR